ncbi:hypothetical protein QTN47_24650 [Danxiaibacter flavus]|uniref:DUF4369 domain-containing protein n=1 Tax=Danxiaibacter flavus TaxID=3049108 RepID=A0ABV3ZMK4_9BACT|nr:hypothetical protein QNM32_24655 [Chitinophagaceae bacterium DXS]
MKKWSFSNGNSISISLTYMSLICMFAFTSCATSGPAFDGPNNAKNIRATVYLDDNSTVFGYLSFSKKSNALNVRIPQQRKTISVPLTEVQGYNMDDNYYAYKLLHPSGKNRLNNDQKSFRSFVKRLTPEHYFLQIYEYQEAVVEQKSRLTKNMMHYYVSLPNGTNPDEIWDLEGEQFFPDFQSKMAGIVNECPELVLKIQQKEIGYYPRKISFKSNNKLKVLMNIANYYQQFIEKNEQAAL